jgi:hypothetical protein
MAHGPAGEVALEKPTKFAKRAERYLEIPESAVEHFCQGGNGCPENVSATPTRHDVIETGTSAQ